jgi:hypothetical protein
MRSIDPESDTDDTALPAEQSGMEPAATIVAKLGGPSAVSRDLGVHRTRVSNWMRPRDKGGTGGIIPHWHVADLLQIARDKGVALEDKDFAPVVPSPESPSGEAA